MGNDKHGPVDVGYNRSMGGNDYVPVKFELEELWMLHDFVRHDPEREGERFRYPVASTKLNELIVVAIHNCLKYNDSHYTLHLRLDELLVIDYWIRRDMKTMAARGEVILLKVFEARAQLAAMVNLDEWPVAEQGDQSYQEAKEVSGDAESTDDTDADDNADDNADPNSKS